MLVVSHVHSLMALAAAPKLMHLTGFVLWLMALLCGNIQKLAE